MHPHSAIHCYHVMNRPSLQELYYITQPYQDYSFNNGIQNDWSKVLKRKIAESFLRRNSRGHLKDGVPHFFVVSQDHVSNRVLLEGVYERGFLDAALLFLRSNDAPMVVAIDAGANIGNHSLYLSAFFDEVLSFEPNPMLDLVLQANAGLVDNVTVFCHGLSDDSGEGVLQTVDAFNLGSATLEAPGGGGRRAENTTSTT